MLTAVLGGGSGLAVAETQTGAILAGAEVSREARYGYLGMVRALPGQQVGQGGVQRYWLDYADYVYEKSPSQDIDARVTSAEAALGWQGSSELAWWGVYLGLRYGDTRLSPDDPENESRGARTRVKLQLEGDRQIAENWRINLIASHLPGEASYWVRLRLPHASGSRLQIGPEVVMHGDPSYRSYQLGGFVGGIQWGGAAVLLKAGVSWPEGLSASAYSGVEFYLPF